MSALVKKEIRLLLPSWIVATLLALVQAITRPYDFYVACLLFFGLTIMALTTIGRETSLNTFSSLLAQPAERMRIWQTKLAVLAVAFLTVLVVWLAAFGIAFKNSFVDTSQAEASYNLFITICLIAAATFTGGLWSTLLLRQIAGAFWLTLLAPAVLAGVTAGYFGENYSDDAVIAILCIVLGIYSVGGFLFARWLFFRAQDVGWSGGVITLPDWKIFARSQSAASNRNWRPIFALLKKEVQLQQVSLFGAAGILGLHVGVVILRNYHHFKKDSVGEVLTSIFWMVWLVLAPVIGSMAVAEERRLGVMEGQLCLPVSRRIQFAVKAIFTLVLGIFLGGVLPMLLEHLAASLGAQNLMFAKPGDNSGIPFFWLSFFVVSVATWLTLLGFFGSTISRSFLQAVGFGIATFFISSTSLTINWYVMFHGYMPAQRLLPMIIAVPTMIGTLLWLGYLNFKDFRPGWPLWRRNLLGLVGASAFIAVASTALYNRVWEVFEPAEPPHGVAKFSLANPPKFGMAAFGNLLVRLPDGRVWVDYMNYGTYPTNQVKRLWYVLIDHLPKIGGAQRFVAGSNWVSATAKYGDMAGVQTDGTLWISNVSTNGIWSDDKMNRVGDETNWQQVIRSYAGVLLLKNDGTLWRWGTNHVEWQINWPNLRTYQPQQIGTGSDWKEICGYWNIFVRKSDGSVWSADLKDEHWKDAFQRETNLDQVSFPTLSVANENNGDMAYVRPDGTLWVKWQYPQNRTNVDSGFVPAGTGTNWTTVALSWNRMVALKSDGSLWQWDFNRDKNFLSQGDLYQLIQKPPARVGIHDDWVAIAQTWDNVIALAADGSLWLWPDREQYEQRTLLKLPKQPQFLGNVFGKTE